MAGSEQYKALHLDSRQFDVRGRVSHKESEMNGWSKDGHRNICLDESSVIGRVICHWMRK